MRVLRLTGTDVSKLYVRDPEPQRGTTHIAPAEYPALLVVTKGSCTVGDDRKPVTVGQAVMVEVGDIVDLRQTTSDVEMLRIEFIDRP